MKIVLTDAQTVVDNLVPADRLSQFGEVVQYGLLTYDEVAEKIADADMVICNKTRLDEGFLKLAKNLKYIGLLPQDTITLYRILQKARYYSLQCGFVFHKCRCTAYFCINFGALQQGT